MIHNIRLTTPLPTTTTIIKTTTTTTTTIITTKQQKQQQQQQQQLTYYRSEASERDSEPDRDGMTDYRTIGSQ